MEAGGEEKEWVNSHFRSSFFLPPSFLPFFSVFSREEIKGEGGGEGECPPASFFVRGEFKGEPRPRGGGIIKIISATASYTRRRLPA